MENTTGPLDSKMDPTVSKIPPTALLTVSSIFPTNLSSPWSPIWSSMARMAAIIPPIFDPDSESTSTNDPTLSPNEERLTSASPSCAMALVTPVILSIAFFDDLSTFVFAFVTFWDAVLSFFFATSCSACVPLSKDILYSS